MQRQNILLFLPDQWRADWTGLDAALPLNTPNLANLAKSGMRFLRAITPSPLCAPARAALASGKEYDRCGVLGNNDYPVGQPTIYGLLRKCGYYVMGCGKFDLAKKSFSWGVDGRNSLRDWGFDDGINSEGKWDAVNSGWERPAGPYMAYLERRGLRSVYVDDMRRRKKAAPFDSWPTPLPDDAYGDNWIADIGLRLISRAPQPWFLQVNFMGPHDPWDVTEAMASSCRGRNLPLPDDCPPADHAAHLAVRQNYAAMIENIDRWLGAYRDKLQAMGQLDSTWIFVMSDHGDMLGDRGLWRKNVPYQAAVAVPLVIAGPDVRAGTASFAPTTILDIGATFIDIAGSAIPSDWDSRSLLPYLRQPTEALARQFVRSGLAKWRLVFDGRHKLIATPSGNELYDLQIDPGERNNLVRSESNIAHRLSQFLQ